MKFGDIVEVNGIKGVVIKVIMKRKWNYCDIVFSDYQYFSDDWGANYVSVETIREDNLCKD